MYSVLKYSFEITEDGKDYSVPQIALMDSGKSISQFWNSLTPEEKKAFSMTEKLNKKINDILDQELFSIADLDKVYKGEPAVLATPTPNKVNTLMEALKKALPPEPKPKAQFASLQEMYDSAKPTKLKKGAAKTVGTSAKKLTFGGGYPAENFSYKPIIITSAATMKLYEELLEPIGLNSPNEPEQQPKKGK